MFTRLPPRPGPVTATWLLTVTMAAISAAIASSWTTRDALVGSGIHWAVVVMAFLVAEHTAIHLPTRRGAHTLFMVELPLVVFMAASADPAELIWARVAASVTYVLITRQRDLLKVSFNAASAGLSAASAIAVYQLLVGDRLVNDPITWIGLSTSALTAGLVSAGTVSIVLTIFDPARDRGERRQELAIGAVQSGVAGLTGVVVVIGLAVSPFTIVFTAGIIVAALTGLSVYGALHRRHSDLTTLYSFSVGFDPRASFHDLVTSIAHLIVDGMRAESIAILTRGPSGRCVVTRVCAGAVDSPRGQHLDVDAIMWETTGFISDSPAIRTLFGEQAERVAVAPLGDPMDPIGVVVVADRSAAEVAFDDHDLELLAAMTRHGGLNLERAVLENRLRGEIEGNRALLASKDRLIAAVSHELRTPLTGILGFAELLTDNDLSDRDRHEMITSIASEAQDVAHIVEDLLTAARFEGGGLAFKSERVDVADLAARVGALAGGRSGRPIALELHQVWALADGPRVRQILRNLVTNAIRYGGDQIAIRSFTNGTVVHLEVCDSGGDLAEADLERIFLPYQTAHDSLTQPGSVGLGLSISRDLARMMKGDLTVRSDRGWTIFTLTLPAASAARSIA